MPVTGYGQRKQLKDRDVAIGYSPLFLAADLKNPRIPWNLWGFTISNMVVANIMAAVNHRNMNLGLL
jgi:hypothetical protein